jgi:starch-binding outer membrane protein, SusD/RagB family
MKRYIKVIISILALNLIFNACQEDFLDRHPLDQVTSVDFFKQPKDLEVYMNQFYNTGLLPEYTNYGEDFGSDNAIQRAPVERLKGTRVVNTTGSLPYGNVRRINYFFDNYKSVEEENDFDDYKQYLGEAYFFRGLIYFNLLKSYGDIQWITTELQPDSPELYEARDPRNIVADNIIAALDSAAMYLTDDRDNGASRVHKWMALLLQSRVALYEGTWEKYHDGTEFGVENPNPEKYFNKVVEATTAIMQSGKFDIYSTGNPSTDYYELYSILREYSSNEEVLFWRKMDHSVGYISSPNRNRNNSMSRPGGNSFTKELADSYLCTDGEPVAVSSLFQGYTTISDEMENRDPRFRQTIAHPDDIWQVFDDTDGSVHYWSEMYEILNSASNQDSPGGYLIIKGYHPYRSEQLYNNEENPSIVYRYAEVLLNFAEAKAELGTLTQSDIDNSIKKLRDRVGMPNLVLADIADDPNWDFPDLSPEINEIRRERRVELAGEGFRWDDIARWAAADELIVNQRPKGFLAAQLNTNPFPVDEDGFLDPYKNAIPDGYGFKLDRDYLNSIPESEIVLNENLKQNPGW